MGILRKIIITGKNDLRNQPLSKVIPGPRMISKSQEEFQKSFNNSSSDLNTDFKINKLMIQDGVVQNTFIYQFTKNLGLTGTINKNDGSLRSVTLIGTVTVH